MKVNAPLPPVALVKVHFPGHEPFGLPVVDGAVGVPTLPVLLTDPLARLLVPGVGFGVSVLVLILVLVSVGFGVRSAFEYCLPNP